MTAFDFFLYAAAIIGVLLLRAETPAPAPVALASEPAGEQNGETAIALNPAPAPAMAAAIAEPIAIALVEVQPVSTNYRTMTSQELRHHCTRRGIAWAHTRGRNRHMLKPAMVAALEALE